MPAGSQRQLSRGLYSYGWLPAVVPAHARRFRIVDRELAAGLELAGAELVDRGEDVEIGPMASLRNEAPLSITPIAAPVVFGPLPVRAAGRLVNSVRVWLQAVRTRRARRGVYPVADVLRFDMGHTFALSGSDELPPRRLAERLPQQAVVVARRGEKSPTLLDAALAAASEQVGRELRPRWASTRAGLVVVFTEDAVLRVAFGRAGDQIAAQLAVLEAIRGADPPPTVADRLPWPVASGRAGLADWSLEQLLPGTRPSKELTPALVDAAVDFLVDLWRLPGRGEHVQGFAKLAETVAPATSLERVPTLRALAERLDRDLAGLPRGFAHGDFFAGNMLVDGDDLTAVLDWDAGGPGRLPFVDLLHLHRTLVHSGDDLWAPAFLGGLLPFARSGGDETVARYARGIGLEADGRLLELLAVGYWLKHTAYQLRTHRHRLFEPAWLATNIESVLNALERFARGGSA